MVNLDVKAMYLDPQSQCSYNVYWGLGLFCVLALGSFFWFTLSFHAL